MPSLLAMVTLFLMLAACATTDSVTVDSTEGSGISVTTADPAPATSVDDSGDAEVTIKSFKFDPDPITVDVGGSVTWTNVDPVGHTVTARDDSFKTGMFFPDESSTVTFDTAGTFPYFCSTHPEMSGTVIVEPAE